MTKQELNEEIAQHLGWKREGEFHSNPDEWEGWRDNHGIQGVCSVPDYLQILEHFMPALEGILEGSLEVAINRKRR